MSKGKKDNDIQYNVAKETRDLQENIAELLYLYSKKTGMTVKDIGITISYSTLSIAPDSYKVDVTIGLLY